MAENERLGGKKAPRYLIVYEEIYKRIKEGVYPLDSQLPSENTLSKEFDVSRMTLRQALKFLRDDGVIKMVQGKGSFVTAQVAEKKSYLDVFQNPVHQCLNEEATDVEIDYYIQPSTEYTNRILQRDPGIIIFLDRWYKKGEELLSYSFSTLPGDIVSRIDMDLKDEASIKVYLEEKIYQENQYSTLNLQFSDAGSISSHKYQFAKDQRFYLLQEEIYGEDKYPVIHTKHYLPIESATIQLKTEKK